MSRFFKGVRTYHLHISQPPLKDGRVTRYKQARPVYIKANNKVLPSSIIIKDKLVTVNEVLMKYPKLHCKSKVGTLAVKMARDAFCGEELMEKCTIAGERDLPGLPTEELQQLKHTLFMQISECTT